MSAKLVKGEIDRFLKSTDPEVLCLQGEWGVGKTFSWNKFLSDAQKERRIGLDRYSYVSLFGLNSLEQLKYAIFENTTGTDAIGIAPSLETFEANAAAVTKSVARKSLRLLQFVPGAKDVAGALPSLSFLAVRKQIVCIDDLERKGNQLSIRDILGLIAHLRDQRSCKVLLILNVDALEGDDKEQFKKYHEKTIDTAITFAPTAEECVGIAITDKSEVSERLARDCVLLGIANIRIIKKVQRFVLQLEPMLTEFKREVLRQAIQTTTLCTWIQFSDDAPPIEFVRAKRAKLALGLDTENLSEEEKRWNLLLEAYGLTGFDDFDLVLLDGIEAGYFDPESLKARAIELQRTLTAAQQENSLEEAWAKYHGSFADNEAEVVEAIFNASVTHTQALTPLNLNGAVRLLKELGRTKEAAQLIEHYVASRSEPKSFWDLEDHPFGSDINDADIRTAFTQKLATFVDDRQPVDVLLKVSRGGHSTEDVELLTKVTVDDFYRLFKAQNDKSQLSRLVRASFEFSTTVPGIAANATEALRRIAKESRLNRFRVRKFGVTVDDC